MDNGHTFITVLKFLKQIARTHAIPHKFYSHVYTNQTGAQECEVYNFNLLLVEALANLQLKPK